MGPMTNRPAGSDANVPDPRRKNNYDAFAVAYSAENDDSLANAYYERPAMLNLLGNVTGRNVLDVGCRLRFTYFRNA